MEIKNIENHIDINKGLKSVRLNLSENIFFKRY